MTKKYLACMSLAIFALLLANAVHAQDTLLTPSDAGIMETQATFEIVSWDEEAFSRVEGADRLTRVSVVKSYTGGIEGEGRLEYLMRYDADGSADFYGLERVIGEVDGNSGSFIFRHTGRFEAGEMTQSSIVLPRSGTNKLEGMRGQIEQTAGHQQEYPVKFEYEMNGRCRSVEDRFLIRCRG